MPIIIARTAAAPIPPAPPDEQTQAAWNILRAYLEAHPEITLTE